MIAILQGQSPCSELLQIDREAAGDHRRSRRVEAARLLRVRLTPARQAGYDAVERRNGSTRRLQIKGRCLLANCKPGQPLGSIDIKKKWDAVLMVLLDENFDATAIYEAKREVVIAALTKPGSKARNERGALSVSKFRSIGTARWPARHR